MGGYIKYNQKPENNDKVIGRRHEAPKRIYALRKRKKHSF
jgi:hypothetical protein